MARGRNQLELRAHREFASQQELLLHTQRVRVAAC